MWRVIKNNQRQLPCHPATLVRVKIIEPGIQARFCDRCKTNRYFTLEEHHIEGMLKMRWLNDKQVKEYLASFTD